MSRFDGQIPKPEVTNSLQYRDVPRVCYFFVIHNISQLSMLTTRALDMQRCYGVYRSTRLSWLLVCSGFAHFVDDIKDEPLARRSYALDI